MSDQYSQGIHTRQAHKAIPEGCYEEEQGLKGFFGPVSHLIKKKPSTSWMEIEGPLRPHMLDLVQLKTPISETSGAVPQMVPTLYKQRLLYNKDLIVSWLTIQKSEPHQLKAHRNADGDILLFCHKGTGEILTEYGWFSYRPGQYIIIPKCLTHVIAAHEHSTFLVTENLTSHYESPDRGLVGRHAIYDPQALIKPDLEKLHESLKHWGSITQVKIQHRNEFTTFRYPSCIFADILGWKGDLYPYTLHMDDMMPLMSHRAHLPPSAHTTFVAREFVVCTFLPRPLEKDWDALKVPFYHQNIDYDEVLFYHAGDFFSRDNLHAGMMSLHPAGFPHGPHPKAVKNIHQKTETNEYAVMIDSRWPLQMDPIVQQIELKEYWGSWRE
ncbi:MAG: homogentisate 1,2-dioxygenase [Bdellovibrionales bacterium]|nr:homogentisate 1,2-dioxygenase [Bdellovibrionales bacterium]